MRDLTKKIVNEFSSRAIEYRRYFHQNPELSFKEYKTAEYIRTKLKKFDIPTLQGISGNSTVGFLDSGKPGPVIAFRADIDALPVTEENNLPFKSSIPGIMHACGHDNHAAVLLAMAEGLSLYREHISGKVLFLFQQAEEDLPGGAKLMVEEGAIKDVDMIFGFHSQSAIPIGKVSLSEGSGSSASCAFRITIIGKSGHVAKPDESINSLTCACMLIEALHQLEGKKISPREVNTLSVTYCSAGDFRALNIIPGETVIGGNVRCLSQEVLNTMISNIEHFSKTICEAFGCGVEIQIEQAYPPVINDKQAVEIADRAITSVGLDNIHDPIGLGGEDFSYFQEMVPGAFINVGFWNQETVAIPSPHHSTSVVFDDDQGLPLALSLMVEIFLEASTSVLHQQTI